MKIDSYTMQARAIPAVILMIPLFIEANYLIVSFGVSIAISATILNIILFVLLVLLANWVRHFGKKVENTLFDEWGGAPTIRFLRYSNSEYNTYKMQEIRKYLKVMFNKLKMPTAIEENENPQKADEIYDAYITNLKALTRDTKKYALLQSENRNYGMWRNLYGIKLYSIIIIVVLIVTNILLCVFAPTIMPVLICGIICSIDIILLLIWLVAVTKSKIKVVATCYAERLFETVITMNEGRKEY